jgi:4-hydroxy-tetrahydrodipicolinate synthase
MGGLSVVENDMFRGSMVALVTPMHEDGALDYESLSRLVEFHIGNGTTAIIAVGTTGESPTLDMQEHCEVIRQVVNMARGRVPVIGGTGSNSTREAIELTQAAMAAGADACLLVTPYYNKPTQEGLYRHYKAVADAVPIPQILYNVPGRTACDLLPETVGRLAKVPNIVGLKEATGDLGRLAELKAICGDSIDLYSGDDATAREFILQGGKGVISVTANVVPKAMQDMCEAALRGDAEEAARIDARIAPLHTGLFVEANPIPVKWALHRMGLMPPGIRLPLTELAERFRPGLEQQLREAGAL